MDLAAFYKITYGLYILSSKENEIPYGCVVNTVFQVTAKPARIAVSCNKDNFTHDKIISSGSFGITVLPESVSPSVIGNFGYTSAKNTDKFKDVLWKSGPKLGMPILQKDGMTSFECSVIETVDVGSHTLFIGDVIDSEVIDPSAKEITYKYYHDVLKGKAPKNAPTYIDESNTSKQNDIFVCSVCGYEYTATGNSDTKFDELPNNWKCPICGAEKSLFVKK